MAPSDNELMEAVRDGRVEKLAVLFERHHVLLYNFFLRLTGNRNASEDLVQDVFIRILKYRAGYRGGSKFVVWMFQIARNAHFDQLRKCKGELPLDDVLVEPRTEGPLPGEHYETNEDAALMRRALDSLPREKREVLMLSRYEGLKLREVAELMGCGVGTIKTQVHRALKDLGRVYFDLREGRTS
jgi:RNA polymerase sigma factor (sigma-70 family)